MQRIDPSIAQEHAKRLSDKNARELRSWIKDELSDLAEMTQQVITAEVMNKYADSLQTQPRHSLQRAFRIAATTMKFFPKLPELLDLCAEQERQQEPEKRYICDENCQCGGSGFIYTKKFSDLYGKEIDAVYRCPRRMKKASQSA